MTLMEKFANLTPKQKEEFAVITNAAELDAFASEHGIDLTDEEKAQAAEYFEKGRLPLSDDDLDLVAGGAAKDESPALAAADGRTHNLPAFSLLCACHHKNKWARSTNMYVKTMWIPDAKQYQNIICTAYMDIKCYKCGQQWEKYE